MSNIVHSTQFEGGFSLEQLENDRGHIYYRACTGSICRYAEDEYIARMYLEGMGWDRPADVTDEMNHAKNRRVEIKVYPAEIAG